MKIRPSDVMYMEDEYVIIEPNGDLVFNEDIEWLILDEEDRKIYDDWFN